MAELHLIDDQTLTDAPVVGALMREHIARQQTETRLLVLGRAYDGEALRLGPHEALPLPRHASPLRDRPLRRWLNTHGPFHTVATWSPQARALADRLVGNAIRRRGERLPILIDTTRLREDRRAGMRLKLGAAEGDLVIWLMVDRCTDGDAMAAMRLLGLTDETGRRVRLVVHPASRRLPATRQMIETLDRTHRLVEFDHACEPWTVLSGCDVALAMDGGRSARLSAAWAAAAGVPILVMGQPVTEVTPWVTWAVDSDNWRGGAQRLVGHVDQPTAVAEALAEHRQRARRLYGPTGGAAERAAGIA